MAIMRRGAWMTELALGEGGVIGVAFARRARGVLRVLRALGPRCAPGLAFGRVLGFAFRRDRLGARCRLGFAFRRVLGFARDRLGARCRLGFAFWSGPIDRQRIRRMPARHHSIDRQHIRRM
ncbi:MAG TPA: hypothetical protein VH165_23440, partial [Kofleriaceae bacterium]|nr:hypothetical protein [Kofleriaceae bacterium]